MVGASSDEEDALLQIHRVRFVDWTPSAITALAFPPLPSPEQVTKRDVITPTTRKKFGTLAVGRANGNIELCEWTGQPTEEQSPQAWVVRKVLPAPCTSKIEALVFALRNAKGLVEVDCPPLSEVRLFSTGGGTDVLEWDLERGVPLRSVSSHGGSIWCIAVNPSSTRLALGCEDGSIRLISLELNAFEHHTHRFDRCKARILSIAWGPPILKVDDRLNICRTYTDDIGGDAGGETSQWSDTWIVAGCSDSSLRRWDVGNGRILDRMQTDKARGERTLVWAVAVLSNSTIVSGDSQGLVKFWDAHTATQLNSMRAHQADVLTLAVGPFGCSVYSAGIDQKIVEFSLVQATSHGYSPNISRWIQICSKHMHSHDIRALATWPPYSLFPRKVHNHHNPYRISPILASGGRDMTVVLTPCMPATGAISAKVKSVNPLATSLSPVFEEAYQRRMSYPTSGVLQVAKTARLIACRKEQTVSVWRIGDVDKLGLGSAEQSGSWELVLEMDLQVKTNLTAVAISDDGAWLAVSDALETKLFNLQKDVRGNRIIPVRIKTIAKALSQAIASPLSSGSTGSSHLCFTSDSSKLVTGHFASSRIIILDIMRAKDGSIAVLRVFDHHRLRYCELEGDRIVKNSGPNMHMEAELRDSDGGLEEKEDAALDPTNLDRPAEAKVVTLTYMTVSADGQWLATADSGGMVNVYNTESVRHHSTLPTFNEPIHTMAFDPSPLGNTILLLGQASQNRLHVYDVEDRCFPGWESSIVSSAGEVVSSKGYANLHDPLAGVFFLTHADQDGSHRREILAWGSNWLCRIDLEGAFDHADKKWRIGRKRGRRGAEGTPQAFRNGGNFKMCHRYRQILGVSSLGDRELVLVERPLLDMMEDQPPPFYKHRFGT